MAETLITNAYPVEWDTVLSSRIRFYTTDCFGNRIEFMGNGDGFTQK